MHAAAAPVFPPSAPLWAAARVLLERMLALFGMPSGDGKLDRAARRDLLLWLAPLEALTRKLLLIDAAQRVASLAPIRRRTPSAAFFAAARTAATHAPHVRFSLAIPRDDRIVADANAPRIRALWDTPFAAPPPPKLAARSPARIEPGRRIALRISAVRQVIERPVRYAQRLARRLARFTGAERARAAQRFMQRGPDRIAPDFTEPLREAALRAYPLAQSLGDTS